MKLRDMSAFSHYVKAGAEFPYQLIGDDGVPFIDRYSARDFPCTTCGAAVGKECRTPTGKRSAINHFSRIEQVYKAAGIEERADGLWYPVGWEVPK